jgi:hypothetical protein
VSRRNKRDAKAARRDERATERPPPPEPDDDISATSTADGLAGYIDRCKHAYLKGQKLLANARRRAPETIAEQAALERELDAMTRKIRHAEAFLAARATSDGGDLLTPQQAEHLLQALGASDAKLATYHEDPQATTAMLNYALTIPEGPFETRIGNIITFTR